MEMIGNEICKLNAPRIHSSSNIPFKHEIRAALAIPSDDDNNSNKDNNSDNNDNFQSDILRNLVWKRPIAEKEIGQAVSSTHFNWLHLNNRLDKGSQVHTVTLKPTEPLKYDTDYFIVLIHGAPVLPIGDVLNSTFAYTSAGIIGEDYIIRFRTCSEPPKMTQSERKEAYRAKRQLLREAKYGDNSYFVDLKTVDWSSLNKWPKPEKLEFTEKELIEIDSGNLYRRKMMDDGTYDAKKVNPS